MVSFSSVVILLGALQGFILFFSIAGLRRGNIRANHIVGIFILCISITLIGRYAYTVADASLLFAKILFVGDFVIYFYGPLLYLYFLQLFNAPPKYRIATWVHFIPLMLFGAIILPLMTADADGYRSLSVRFEYLFYFLELLAIVQNVFYLIINVRLIRDFQQQSYQLRSDTPQITFYKVLLAVTLSGIFFWSASFILRFIGPEEVRNYLGYQMVWICLSILIIGLGYYTLRFPEVFDAFEPAQRLPAKTVSPENLDALAQQLKHVLSDKKPYLEPRLTLPELAEMTGIQMHLLSRVINEKFGKNFFEFINEYRVEEFKRRATPENLRQMTVLAIALEAGFNSKSTFNAAFKKITRITPREYLQTIRN